LCLWAHDVSQWISEIEFGDWSDRYRWIVEAAPKNRHKQFVIDGEAVVLGVDCIADFNALHWASRQT
jgi:ATP-dependent DNA ligase